MGLSREDITNALTEGGVEVNKAVITNILNLVNAEIRNVRVESANKALQDFSDWKSPEDYKALQDEITALKDESAKSTRMATYKANNINVEDEDILNLVESKFKDSKDLAKDIAEYAKSHPSFVLQTAKKEEQKQEDNPASKVEFTGNKSGGEEGKQKEPATLQDAVREMYKAKGQA